MQTTVSAMFELYLRCTNLAESSRAVKKLALRYFVDLFGDLPISSVGYAHGEDFRNSLAAGRSKSSANIYFMNFKPFWSWLTKRGYIDRDPFAGVQGFVIGEVRKEVFTVDETERVLKVADSRWKLIIYLGLSSLRRAEILNLTVEDIDFDSGFITVRPKKDTATTWEWNIKNHNQAIVPLIEPAEKYLIELIEDLRPNQPYILLDYDRYERLMQRKKKGTLDFRLRNCPWDGFNRCFNRLLQKASVSKKKFHGLRATFATNMSKHLKIEDVQCLMRHSSISTTAKYYIQHKERELVSESGKILEKYYVT